MIALTRLLTIVVTMGAACSALAQQDDHGDNRDTAARLHYDIAQSGTLESSADVDYFRVDLQGRARVELRSTMNLDAVGTLYDSEGGLITSADDIDPSAGNYNFSITEELERGVYYLEVAGFTSSDIGDYQVLARFDLGDDDHGDTFGSSSILALGPRVAGSINNSSDVDWFRIDFPVSTYAEVITASQNPIAVELYFAQNDGTVLPFGSEGELVRDQVWHGTFDEGTYYFGISGSVSAYNIRVEAEDIGCEVALSPLSRVELSEFELAVPVSSTSIDR